MIALEAIVKGFEGREFFLEYLPVISLENGRCVGAEALIRWRRPDGVVYPDQFIPVVENTPYSGPITHWVIDTVADELVDWLRLNPDMLISINVPPELLGRGGLLYAGEKSGLSEFKRQIIIEITERGLPDRLGVDSMPLMSEYGVRLALDDVTLTGANLAILSRCPFNTLKIDRAAVMELESGKPDPHWLQILSTLIATQALHVIVEGVETDYQAQRLRDVGIRFAQGYLFSQSISARNLMAFHAERSKA